MHEFMSRKAPDSVAFFVIFDDALPQSALGLNATRLVRPTVVHQFLCIRHCATGDAPSTTKRESAHHLWPQCDGDMVDRTSRHHVRILLIHAQPLLQCSCVVCSAVRCEYGGHETVDIVERNETYLVVRYWSAEQAQRCVREPHKPLYGDAHLQIAQQLSLQIVHKIQKNCPLFKNMFQSLHLWHAFWPIAHRDADVVTHLPRTQDIGCTLTKL